MKLQAFVGHGQVKAHLKKPQMEVFHFQERAWPTRFKNPPSQLQREFAKHQENKKKEKEKKKKQIERKRKKLARQFFLTQ